MLNALARRVLPASGRRAVRSAVTMIGDWKMNRSLSQLKRRSWRLKPGSVVKMLGYTIRINDAPNFYMLYKDIFAKRIYHFDATRPDPLVLDCGSNIGMSILYFKHVYPQARIAGFEPDPVIFRDLQDNVTRNHLTGVTLLQAAVANRQGVAGFYSDGKYGSCLAAYQPGGTPEGWTNCEVQCVRLRDYLSEAVDFAKLNIEGAESEVLADSADRLRMIRTMAIEYHHHPELPRTLHQILGLLHEQGFEYLVYDFDSETNGAVCPPFRLGPETRYYLLIYARRVG